ncbi:MAG: D-sedoheptulose 7-phosphate isomerase [Candidatus Eisenbacteria bacterium]|nr:D-sedoheptulose 7-phosphate isomerase [Candidatus Eisenbacteria bacterium]
MRRLEPRCARAVAEAAESAIACLESGGTVFFCGNGGSAADSQHLAAELAGRYFVDRPALAAIALTTNSSSLTAIGNDYGFDQTFSRQLEGLGTPGDVLVAITTSGASANVRRAVETAHALGMTVIGMTGSKGASFAALCDHALVTPHPSTPRIQEGHITMGHALCELIERAMFPPPRGAGAGRKGASVANRDAGAVKRRRGAAIGGGWLKRRGGAAKPRVRAAKAPR